MAAPSLLLWMAFFAVLLGHTWAGSYGPSFIQEPPSQVLYSNDTGLVLDCLAHGEPSPIIDWVDDAGHVLPLLPSVARRLHNGSLHFLPFSHSNSGIHHHVHGQDQTEYSIRCRASNAYGRIVSKLVKVKSVLPSSVLSVRVQGDSIQKYNTAVLRCQGCAERLAYQNLRYNGFLSPLQVPHSAASITEVVSWMRGNTQLFPSARGDGKFHVVPSGDLHILRADFADAIETYSCRVRNTLTGVEEVSPQYNLVINDSGIPTKPMQLRQQDLYYSFKADETAVLTCNVQSTPPPAFSWFRVRNNLLEPISRSSRIYLSGGVLIIDGAEPAEDSGQYRCTARNERGEVSLSMNLDVTSDIVVDVVPAEQIIDIGRKARLECLTEERDRDSISWRKDGRALPSHARIVVTRQVLQIFNLQRDDYGMYQCFVTRAGGRLEAQGSSELRLGDAAPMLTYRFIDHTLQPGQQLVSLKCSARGSPTPRIIWTLNGFPLPKNERFLVGQYVTLQGDVVSHVNITNVRVEDGGQFMCKITNRAGTVEHSAKLNVYGPPYVHPIGELKAVVGRPFKVICPAAGYPLEKVLWSKGGKPLPFDRRHQVYHNGTLVISKVTRKDAGDYSCSAVNRAGTEASQTGILKVIVPPTINKFSVGENLRLGQRVSMLCSVTDGDLPLTLTWYKDAKLLRGGLFGGVSITNMGNYESVLRIDHLRPEHNANFTCVAENYAGRAQHSQTLRVKVAPFVESFTFPKNLTQGKRLRVICTVTEGDRPLNVEWHKDGVPLRPGKDVHVKRIDEFTSLLAIAHLLTEHAGNYSCVASNAVAKYAKSAILTIRVPPEWISKPKDLEAVEGEDVFFPCRVSGVPEPMITWRKMADSNSRHPLLELNLQRPVFRKYRLLMNGTLYIQKVAEADEGKFLCEAENGVNEALGQVVTLKVNAPPKFDVAHAGPVTGRTGEVMELVCEASGDDHISIKWRKDGRDYLTLPGKSSTTEIRELDRVTSKLRISNSTPHQDAGRYACEATNAYGKSHFSIDVTIWEPPPTPGNLSLLEISSRSVKISWTIENASPRVERLVVQWKEQNENWYPEGKQNILPGLMTETVVSGLRPWGVYHLRVFAENQLGKSKEGKVLQFVTNGEKPGGSPRNVRITALSSDSLEITWDDPEEKLRHGPITRYNIGYKEYGTQNFRFIDVDKFDHSSPGSRFVLSRLRKHCQYEIVLQAINVYGEGPLSTPSLGRTLEDVPDGSPDKVHCVALTSTTIQVSWHPPPLHLRNGIIKGYKVLYAPQPGRIPEMNLPLPKISRLSTVTTVLENLRKFSNYTIQVLAFTAAGDGKYSKIITCTTHSDAPGPPRAIKAIVKSASSIVVSWLPPENSNGEIQRYHVYVRAIQHDGRTHTKFNRPAEIQWLTVDDLQSDRQYQFWVTAVTSMGEGMSSNVVTQSSSEKVPARIFTIDDTLYFPLRTTATLGCRFVGDPTPTKKWFLNGREETWLQDGVEPNKDHFGEGDLSLDAVTLENQGNYTCYVENRYGSDSVTYQVNVQVPPKPPTVHVVQTSPDSISIRWRVLNDGNSPVTKTVVSYKVTYGEWSSEEVGWHQSEHALKDLHCGREYHVYVVLVNALGASAASEVLTVRTQGGKPTAPKQESFLQANTTFVTLKPERWDEHRCEILYFVIEYKLASSDTWTTVTNDLLPQPRYSIRGLIPDTNYNLKITAHNHAGSTTMQYTAQTLPENYSGAAPYGNENNVPSLLMGLGLKSILLIVVSFLCLFLASIGVCICLRKKHPPHGMMIAGYGEIPKSCTMENRTNLDHQQLYATIQRKQPPVPPFSHSKGFDTMNNASSSMATFGIGLPAASVEAGVSRLKGVPETSADICPYATSTQRLNNFTGMGTARCNTLGRLKNLEMTEYQKQKLLNEANTVRIKESKEYTLSLGRNHKGRRKLYSESEEYDTDTSAERDLGHAATFISATLGRRKSEPDKTGTGTTATSGGEASSGSNASGPYTGIRFRQQFNL